MTQAAMVAGSSPGSVSTVATWLRSTATRLSPSWLEGEETDPPVGGSGSGSYPLVGPGNSPDSAVERGSAHNLWRSPRTGLWRQLDLYAVDRDEVAGGVLLEKGDGDLGGALGRAGRGNR